MDATSTSHFVHLHVHSEYSLLDGAIGIADLVKKTKKMGHTAVALTDHGNMFGAIEFYGKCKESGIKPILGTEIYWQGGPSSRDLNKYGFTLARSMDAFHLVVLAKSKVGYQSLCRLVSSAYLEGQEQQAVPTVSLESLCSLSSDLIGLSSCLRGEFGSLIELLASHCSDPLAELKDPSEELQPIVQALDEHVALMRKVFGDDAYYIELIDNSIPQQKRLLPTMVAIARHYKLPVVATADSHYLNPEDAEAHAVLTAIKNELTMRHIRDRIQNSEFHLFSNEEFEEKYGYWPEALANQQKIAELCTIDFKFGEYFLPRFELSSGESEADALRRLAQEGLNERFTHIRPLYGSKLNAEKETEYWKRLEYEVEVIISMGFPGYFLIVQDFINWAKNNDIPVGPGRGSGAGSVVAWALRITDLDPLRFNLIFERFLNPERVSMPDFDVDFCQERRDEVIRYVTKKYGADNVAQITTFGKMKAKAALRDVGRVLEIGYGRVDRIAKLIPNELDIKLSDALAREPRILEEARKDEMIQKLLDLALKIEGLSRHTSVHAAGVVIADGGMANLVPVYKGPDGTLITQYEMKNAEKVGLVKFDFLGLKTLTVIARAVKLIRATKDPKFNIDTIDLERKEVYELVSSAHSVGIFQLESSGMQSLLKKLKPSRFEDIIAVVALFRPGPLGSGMVDDFIERKHGRQEIEYLHPLLESVLADTYGIILYQEQVQKIAAILANYTLGEADLLRRAMGKKKPEEMAKQKARFVSGCHDNKVNEKLADEIFELMAKFAAYGFNKSHSAAYGLVSYQTAYLKTFYPEQFMAAIMTCDLDNADKIVRYIEECRRLKFTIYPPDINRSYLEFDVPRDKAIGFGLAAIKGIGGTSIEAMIEERKKSGKFGSLTDFAKRVDLHKLGKKTLELLIQGGGLDGFGKQRPTLMSLLSEMVKYSEAHHSAKSHGQRLLFDEFDDDPKLATRADWEEQAADAEASSSPIEWLHKEKKLLSVYLSSHPTECYGLDVKRFGQIKLSDIAKHIGKKGLHCVALLGTVTERLTKKGKRMSYFPLEDETGSWEAVAFEGDLGADVKFEAGTMVLAQLNIQQGFDGNSINVRIAGLQTLEQVRRKTIKHATIQVTSQLELDAAALFRQQRLIQRLNSMLIEHPGPTPLGLELSFEKAQVKIKPGRGGIDLSDRICQSIFSLKREGISLLYN